MTNQPIWEFIANLGDANPMTEGGFFVYRDKTGVYEPHCILFEPHKNHQWQTREFICEQCSYLNGILSDNKHHPDKPAWFADRLDAMATAYGQTKSDIVNQFLSNDPLNRAQAWRMVGEYFGYDNLDNHPELLTRYQVYNRFREECY